MTAREIRFVIPGRVGGKGRPRATIRGGHAAVYTPAKTASMEQMVRGFGAAAMAGQPLLEGPLHLSVVVNLTKPVSWSKKKAAATVHPTGKPDLDNVVKLIGDALNGVIWQDDSQIASLHIARRFVHGCGESTEIFVHCMTLGAEIAVAA
jgi:Holliday junction resolvase RusA-like endonuclease